MKADEEIEYGKLAEFTDHLIRKGLHGIIPLGSTGKRFGRLQATE
ncbi:MAG: hypothetical protein WCJ54_09650 [Actinomycetota bacterium]